MAQGTAGANILSNDIDFVQGRVIDASGRLRVSQLSTIGEYKVLNNVFNSFTAEKVGTGTFADQTNKTNMIVTSGQYCIIQSKQYHPYLNGKSQLIELTTANFGDTLDVEKSIGYISSNAVAPYNTELDGIRLFKDVTNVYYFQIWRNGINIVNVARDDWNDKLDGTGASGMTIDFDNFNVFGFDFLYLGGTAITLYVMYNGEFRIVYRHYYANTDSEPFVLSPNKPIRYEIRSTTGSGSMKFICAMVGSESINYRTIGQSAVVSGVNAGITLASGTNTYMLCGVRKVASARDIFAVVRSYAGVLSTNSDYVQFMLVLNPTSIGGVVAGWTSLTNTPFEYVEGIATNVVTGGTIIESSFGSQQTTILSENENILARLNSTINNTMDAIYLCARPVLATTNILATGLIHVDWLNQ